MNKSADAFRTISEVADWLDTPAHVLRFWESKFTQVRPVKRAGGRRYYRPADMKLLGGIKRLLHEEGMTIKGVQKLLRQQGIAHVAGLSQPLGDAADDVEVSGRPIDNDTQRGADIPAPDSPQQPVETTGLAPTTPEAADAKPSETQLPLDSISKQPVSEDVAQPTPPPPPNADVSQPPTSGDVASDAAVLPSFRNRRLDSGEKPPPQETSSDAPESTTETSPSTPVAAPDPPPVAPDLPPAIRIPDLPQDAPDDTPAEAGALTALARLPRPISAELALEFQRIATALRATGGAGGRQ